MDKRSKRVLGICTLVILLVLFFLFTRASSEEAKIDSWIQTHNLNQYGDSKDTAYMGGNPLFKESAQAPRYKDRYEYIEKRHPDKPWEHSI